MLRKRHKICTFGAGSERSADAVESGPLLDGNTGEACSAISIRHSASTIILPACCSIESIGDVTERTFGVLYMAQISKGLWINKR